MGRGLICGPGVRPQMGAGHRRSRGPILDDKQLKQAAIDAIENRTMDERTIKKVITWIKIVFVFLIVVAVLNLTSSILKLVVLFND
jgi:hypothetical protein